MKNSDRSYTIDKDNLYIAEIISHFINRNHGWSRSESESVQKAFFKYMQNSQYTQHWGYRPTAADFSKTVASAAILDNGGDLS